MPTINFKATVSKIGSWNILRLPVDVSKQLPSRGMTLVQGTIDGRDLLTALEPDGLGSHWFKLDKTMSTARVGDTVTLVIEPSKNWPEPPVPKDILDALTTHTEANNTWKRITPLARWEWIRWIRATNQAETRNRRIEVACSKLKAGMRRPCCFNANMCTEPSVSKSGVLLEPSLK